MVCISRMDVENKFGCYLEKMREHDNKLVANNVNYILMFLKKCVNAISNHQGMPRILHNINFHQVNTM